MVGEVLLLTILLLGGERSTVKAQVANQPTPPPCPVDFILNPEKTICYHFSQQMANYNTSFKYCDAMASDLLMLENSAERRFLIDTLTDFGISRAQCKPPGNCVAYWVGLEYVNARPTDTSPWFWGTSERPLSASSASMAPFLAKNTRQCGALQLRFMNGYITLNFVEKNCNQPLRYICKKYASCPYGYFLIPEANNCYRVNPTRMMWVFNAFTCYDFSRGHLAFFSKMSQIAGVTKYLMQNELAFRKNCSGFIDYLATFWIGGKKMVGADRRCDVPYSWHLSPSTAIPLRFDDGSGRGVNSSQWTNRRTTCEPGKENCLYIDTSYRWLWQDDLCESRMCALCEAYPRVL